MAKNVPLGMVAMILIAASTLFMFFTILPGVAHSTPLDKTYFLQADTSGITGARDITQWTYFYFCGQGNLDCGSARAAPAFGKAWASNAANVPDGLGGGHGDDTTSTRFFYLWRFGWVFFLITLFFQAIALFTGLLACCGRLGSAISAAVAFAALIFDSCAAALMTVTFVQARNHFHSAGRSATLGRYAFGWVWGSWAAIFLANILFCLGTRGDKTPSSGGSRWRRRRSVRSGTYDGRRVKDDYS